MTNTPSNIEDTQRLELYCPSCDRSFAGEMARCPDDGTKLVLLVDASENFIGKEIDGRFTIEELLGRGGMGAVYRAKQHSVGREVAIKIIDPRYIHDKSSIKRFYREAKLSAGLSQPNTVSVIDYGQTRDGVLYLAMEMIYGKELDVVMSHPGLTLSRVVRIAIQLCDALEAAHRLGVVHRDLKPGNIMILDDPPGRDMVKVLDFGIAKPLNKDALTLTNTETVMGTPLYISPEAATGEEIDGRSDLYSLGVILYEMLTGRLPFKGESVTATMRAHVTEDHEPLPASVRVEMRELVDKLLKKYPSERYQHAAEVRDELVALSKQHLSEEGVGTLSSADSHEIDLSQPALASPSAPTPAPLDAQPETLESGAMLDLGPRSESRSASDFVFERRRRRLLPFFLLAALAGGAAVAFVTLSGEKPAPDPAAAPTSESEPDHAAASGAAEDTANPVDPDKAEAEKAEAEKAKAEKAEAEKAEAEKAKAEKAEAEKAKAEKPKPTPRQRRLERRLRKEAENRRRAAERRRRAAEQRRKNPRPKGKDEPF